MTENFCAFSKWLISHFHCNTYIGRQWRNFVTYLCQLVFAAILWVKLLEMFVTLMKRKYPLSVQVDDHAFLNYLVKFYLNNMVIIHPVTPYNLPNYTTKTVHES